MWPRRNRSPARVAEGVLCWALQSDWGASWEGAECALVRPGAGVGGRPGPGRLRGRGLRQGPDWAPGREFCTQVVRTGVIVAFTGTDLRASEEGRGQRANAPAYCLLSSVETRAETSQTLHGSSQPGAPASAVNASFSKRPGPNPRARPCVRRVASFSGAPQGSFSVVSRMNQTLRR